MTVAPQRGDNVFLAAVFDPAHGHVGAGQRYAAGGREDRHDGCKFAKAHVSKIS